MSGEWDTEGIRDDVTAPETRVDRITVTEEAPPRLLVLSGDRPGRSIPVTAPVVLGRSHQADLRIDQQGVSRNHARIWPPAPGQWAVQDLNSRNGTYVNGDRVAEHVLTVGDRLQLGNDVVVLFTYSDPGESRVVEDERLASVSHVASTVAHDFNNLIGVVLASLDYVGTDALMDQASEDAREALEDARTAAQEACELAKRLLSLGRPPATPKGAADLSAIGRQALKLIRRLLPPSITLEIDIAPKLFVEASADEVHQVLVNLCVNARDAMPSGGTLHLRAHRAEATELPSTLTGGRPFVICEVEDTGVGMSEAVRARMFTPFFTTKGSGRGSGLGLAMVHSTIKNRGGLVKVDSSPGNGCRVRFFLPASSLRRVNHPTLADSSLMLGADELHIVLSELDPLMLRSTTRLLSRAGHQVTPAVTREDILKLATGEEVNAAIVDARMLSEDLDVIEKLHEMGIPVLVSGQPPTQSRATRPLFEMIPKGASADLVERALTRARALLGSRARESTTQLAR